MLDLSLCMIVKNEVQHLERCLTSIRDLVCEIIIGDTGSDDGSMDIARRFGARIVPVAWEDNFAQARNTVLAQATSSWILVLDADEEAVGWSCSAMLPLLSNSEVFGYYIQMVSYVGDPASREFVTDSVCRLFRNDPRIRFRGRIHEEAAQSIQELPGSPIAFSSLTLAHYGYLQSEIKRKDKHLRNLSILEEALAEAPEDVLLRYALGTEYFQAEQYAEAAALLLPLLNEISPSNGYGSDLYIKAACSLYLLGQNEQACQIIDAGLAHYADFSDLYDLKASILMKQGKATEALELLNTALSCGDVSAAYTTTSGCGTYRTHCSAARVCERLLRFQEALRHYESALSCRPDYLPAWTELVPFLLLDNRPIRLIGLLLRYPQALNSELLTILIPSALNARSTEIVQYVLLKSPYNSTVIPPLLDVMRLFQEDKDEVACSKLYDMLRSTPGDPMLVRYLWAAAWKRQDASQARHVAEQICSHDSLYLVQLIMEGCEPADSSFSDWQSILQILVQVGAWESVLRLYRHANGRMELGTIPPSLLCGLLKAPSGIKKEWCRLYENDFSKAHQSRFPNTAEKFIFTLLAQSCGTFLDLPASHSSSPTSPAAHIGEASLQLAKASYYGSLAIEWSDFRIYFRSFSFR
ncbi:TPR domain-containing glycosyltransferase [Paenibacillus sp. RC67]|uniref:glycosyltransferase family 2 protein n=1 Tax=Paenibacillus sp. RC67 TaxID=3039392 RepID=UPI0024AE85C7|nr:TPR domain-containing glycosyltransferase [Paenibacillus sp. RC67]